MSANPYLAPSPVVPGFLLITAITQAFPMVVSITDSDYNTYTVGQLVRLNIPASYGMQQANGQVGRITLVSGTNFSLNLNSSGYDVFTVPNPLSIPTPSQPATLSPAGIGNGYYNTQVEPFHSLNGNIGN